MTAHHWRTIRRRLASEGINDPMKMSSLHALLDATEDTILQSFQYDPKQPNKAQMDRERFLDDLYRPEIQAVQLDGDGYKSIPDGFDDGGDDAWDWSSSGDGAE